MSSDFAAWAEAQAGASARCAGWTMLDLEHLAEEIADLSNRERDALESHLETLVMHLLKWRYQPDQRSRSWEATIKVARRNIAKLLRRSPSLRRDLPASLDEIYPNARIRAGAATGLADDAFPELAPSLSIRSPATGCPEVRHGSEWTAATGKRVLPAPRPQPASSFSASQVLISDW